MDLEPVVTDVDSTHLTGSVTALRVRPAAANWGRWVVTCATSWCTNAWMPDLGEQEWLCDKCGVPTGIVWPPDPIAIEAILLMRPDPNTRSWVPGETLSDLIMENASHGILPDSAPDRDRWADPDAAADLIVEAGGRVVGGLVYGPVEAWRVERGTDPSITAAGEPRAYRQITEV